MVRLSTGPDSNQNVETPPDWLYAFNKRYGDICGPIIFDLAASRENAKAPEFFTEEDDSLIQDWSALAHRLDSEGKRGFMLLNPPFRRIEPWAKKCAEADMPVGINIALLIPTATGSNYFRDYIYEQALTEFLNGRLFFDLMNPFPKDCNLHLYGKSFPGKHTGLWEWKKDVPDHLILRTKKERA